MLTLCVAFPFAAVLATPFLGCSREGGERGDGVTKVHFHLFVTKRNKVSSQREEGPFGSAFQTKSLL